MTDTWDNWHEGPIITMCNVEKPCPSCGNPIPEDEAFCDDCGAL